MIDRNSRANLLHTTAYGIEQRVGGGRWIETAIVAVKAIYSIYQAQSELDSEKKKAEALAAISAQLAQILHELGNINGKLDRIYEKLDQIEDKIDQEPYRAAAIDNAGARETITENFEHWSSDAATQDDLRDARDAKARIARNTRILMAGRKMAYIYDVILSYIFELNLDLMLDTPKSTLTAATSKVIDYLKAAKNPEVEGSIAFYHAASRPEYDALLAEEAQLDREDYIGVVRVRKEENKWGFLECEYDHFHVVLGSLRGRDLRWKQELREERKCYAYNYPGDHEVRAKGPGVSDRAVPAASHIDKMLERFIPHADVVNFTEVAIEVIDQTIAQIETRLESQLIIMAAEDQSSGG